MTNSLTKGYANGEILESTKHFTQWVSKTNEFILYSSSLLESLNHTFTKVGYCRLIKYILITLQVTFKACQFIEYVLLQSKIPNII